jgi:hypothetical protein
MPTCKSKQLKLKFLIDKIRVSQYACQYMFVFKTKLLMSYKQKDRKVNLAIKLIGSNLLELIKC